MSGYKTHTIGATILALVFYGFIILVAQFIDIPIITMAMDTPSKRSFLLIIAVLFALWPDVDTNSVGQNIFYSVFLVVDVTLILFKFYIVSAYFGLLALLPVLAKHRGWTHSKLACFILPLPILFIPVIIHKELVYTGFPYYLAAITGYTSHLIIDRKFF